MYQCRIENVFLAVCVGKTFNVMCTCFSVGLVASPTLCQTLSELLADKQGVQVSQAADFGQVEMGKFRTLSMAVR